MSLHPLQNHMKYRGKCSKIFECFVLHGFGVNLTSILENARFLIDFAYNVAIWRASDGPTGLSVGSPGAPREPSGIQITILTFY